MGYGDHDLCVRQVIQPPDDGRGPVSLRASGGPQTYLLHSPPTPAPIPYAMGRVCSALPGSTAYGMGAPYVPVRTRGRERCLFHPGAGQSPTGGIVLTVAAPVRHSAHGIRLVDVQAAWAPAGLEQGETGAQARPGAGPRGERSEPP